MQPIVYVFSSSFGKSYIILSFILVISTDSSAVLPSYVPFTVYVPLLYTVNVVVGYNILNDAVPPLGSVTDIFMFEYSCVSTIFLPIKNSSKVL